MKLVLDNRDPEKIDLSVATKNEENRLCDFISHHKSFNIILLDDNSSDNTRMIAKKNNCTIFLRERDKEPYSIAPTEYAHFEYIKSHSKTGICLKLDVDEFIDENYISIFSNGITNSKINIIKRRIDRIRGLNYELFKSEQPLVLRKSEFTCNPESLHEALLIPKDKTENLTIYVKVFHLGHPYGIEKLKKIIHYIGIEKLETDKKNKSYFLFICKRYLKPYLLFPIKRINWLIRCPKLYLSSMILNTLEILASFYILINKK